jgi:hypothetical protein
MNKFLFGLVLGILISAIASKFFIDNALFRLAYCKWGAVEQLWNSK